MIIRFQMLAAFLFGFFAWNGIKHEMHTARMDGIATIALRLELEQITQLNVGNL